MKSIHLEVQEITDLASLIGLEPEWNHFWTRCPAATPFQRPEWLLAWIQVFHPGPLCTLAVRDSGRLIAVAPMYIQINGPERILAPVGAAISDYLDWLIDPEFRHLSPECLLTEIQRLDTAWTSLDLSDIPGNSPLLTVEFRSRHNMELRFHDACPVLQLPATVEELKNVIPSHQLRSVKTARKKIQKAGQARIELATLDTLEQLLEALFHLHEARWSYAGEPGVLASNDVQQFHRRVAPLLLKKDVLRLYALRFNHQIIAALYALFERDTAYCYLQGFDPEFAEFSPGAQMLASVIEDAVRHRKRAIDFLRGQEAYKYAWGAADVPTYRLRANRSLLLQKFPAAQIAA